MNKKKKIVKKTKKTAKTPNTINGVDEAEFLIVLDNISKRLANKFKFGCTASNSDGCKNIEWSLYKLINCSSFKSNNFVSLSY
jgi:translation initiation factor 1 (eIF-1/SUI1)